MDIVTPTAVLDGYSTILPSLTSLSEELIPIDPRLTVSVLFLLLNSKDNPSAAKLAGTADCKITLLVVKGVSESTVPDATTVE
ncbi:hypothetical protein D3C73_785190 [compost metagenome]